MQIFPEWVVEILKKWATPHQVTFKFPPPPGSTSLSVHSVELVYQKQHVSKLSPTWKSKTVFRLDCTEMKMNNFYQSEV